MDILVIELIGGALLEWLILLAYCGSLTETGLYRLLYLDAWSPVGGELFRKD